MRRKVLSAEGIFFVACDAAEKTVGFAPTSVGVAQSGTAYTLRLLGGTDYGDNAFYGKEDRVVTDTLFYLHSNPSEYRKDTDIESYTLEVSAGANRVVMNGEEMVWQEGVYENKDGRLMVPLQSAMVSLPKECFQGILWDESNQETVVIWYSHVYRFKEGEAVYTRNGKEIAGTAKVERKDGVIYIPFETMQEFWDEEKISCGKGKGKITGTIRVPKEESGAEGQ